MVGGQDINMIESSESKLDAIINTLSILSNKILEIGGVVAKLHNNATSKVTQSKSQLTPASTFEDVLLTQQCKKSRVSFLEKFDGTCFKFQGFVNQIQLMTILQFEHYPIEESRVGLVRTLLTRQALSWFAPLFEKKSPILSNFEAFLEAFGEAFEEHDKTR